MQSFPRSIVPSFSRSLVLSFPISVVPAFRRPNFYQFFVEIEKFFQKWIPTLFYGGRVPKKVCDFSKKKISSLPPPEAKKNFLSPSRQNFQKKNFSKSKNSSIFELPDPKIGG